MLHRKLQSGFSLVELMIGLVLGLVVISAAGKLFVGTKQSFLTTDALAGLDESGRFAMDFLSADLRMAGYLSCGGSNAKIANAVDGGGAWMYDTMALEGFEGGVDTMSSFTADVQAGSDAVIIHRAEADPYFRVASHDAAGAELTLVNDHDFNVGELLVVSDPACTQAAVFQMTGGAGKTVEHDSGSPPAPGNCTANLMGDFDCDNASPAFNGTYRPGSMLTRFWTHAYYILPAAGADPARLVRKRLSHSDDVGNPGATTVVEELLDGVESMQILYGINDVKDGRRVADDYVAADAVADWADVVSLRVALLIRSETDGVRTKADQSQYDLLGTDFDPADDRRMRKVYTNVITLRNTVP